MLRAFDPEKRPQTRPPRNSIQLCIMHMHPTLTLSVYVLIGLVLIGVFTYMFFYTRGLRSKRDTLNEKGRMPVSREEGIAVATIKKEESGRTGTLN